MCRARCACSDWTSEVPLAWRQYFRADEGHRLLAQCKAKWSRRKDQALEDHGRYRKPAVWVLKRNAARVVLLNADGNIFLIRSIDPADPSKPAWWEIPGGGIEAGETSAETAERELWEEAGFESATVGPIVWVQHVEFDFGGYHFDQDEVIHVAYTTETEIKPPAGLEALEAIAFQEARWWSLEEVMAADVAFLPPRLPELLPALVANDLPDPPLDITPA